VYKRELQIKGLTRRRNAVSSTVDRRRNRICSGGGLSPFLSRSPPRLLRCRRDPRAIRFPLLDKRDITTPDEIRLDIAANERREQLPLFSLSLSLFISLSRLQIRAGSAGSRVSLPEIIFYIRTIVFRGCKENL